MTKVAAYQAPLLRSGSTEEAIDLIAVQVRACESIGAEFLCCPEAVLGGLADYASRPFEIAIDMRSGQLQQALEPIASETVTTITEGMASSLPRHDRRLGAGAQVVPFPKRAVCSDPKDFDPFGT